MEKYNVFDSAKAISKNTKKAINAAKPWFLRPLPKMAIIVAMIVLDGVTTYISIYAKLSVLPLLSFVLTVMFAFLLNVPQEQAALYLKDYLRHKKPRDLIVFLVIECGFVALQIYLSLIKVAVTPDLVGSATTLGGVEAAASNTDSYLITGMAGALIVSSVVSSLVCFTLGLKEDPDRQKLEVLIKIKNDNNIVKIREEGARKELESIDAQELNTTDDINRRAALEEVDANTAKNMMVFRDRLERRVNPDGINDITDKALEIVETHQSDAHNQGA